MSAIPSLFQRGPFTGWHMLTVMVLFFGTIISVNLTMAYFATSSWSGLIVKNTYVASQKFDDDVAETREMKSRGWKSNISVDGGLVRYELVDKDGAAVPADSLTATLSRPVDEAHDQTIVLQLSGEGIYSAPAVLNGGQWLIQIVAMRGDDVVYRDVQRIIIDVQGAD